jgi:hypothetical protein
MSSERVEFRVSLQDIKLSKDRLDAMEAAIRKSVLNEIATLDLKGDYVVENLVKEEELMRALGPTRGIRVRKPQ